MSAVKCKWKQQIDTISHPLEWPKSRTPTPNTARMWSNRNIYTLLIKMQHGKPLWKAIWWFLTKLNIFSPYKPQIVLLGISSKELHFYSHKNPHTDVCSSFVHNCQIWETTKIPLSRWMNKTYIHMMEYYATLKRNELLNHFKKMDEH